MARTLVPFNLNTDELEIVKLGMADAISGIKPVVELAAYNEKIQELARARRKAQSEKMATVNKEFLDKAAKEKGAVKTESGLVYLSLKDGNGASPGTTDAVNVNYRMTLPDGREVDSSYKRSKSSEFKLNNVIKCWSEGVQKMKFGGKAKLTCPASLAYGENGKGDLILPGAALAFEIELLDSAKETQSPDHLHQ